MTYKAKKIDCFATLVSNVVKLYCENKFNVYYENTHYLNEVKDNSFFLIPKHQSGLDILLCAALTRKELKKNPYYIMKDSLPGILEYLGGLRITRGSDLEINEQLSKEEKRKLIEDAKKQKNEIYHLLTNLVLKKEKDERGNIIVSYIEGTRKYKMSSKISKADFKSLQDVQQKSGISIPFCPLDIYYEDAKKAGSDIILKVGKPIIIGNEKSDLEELVNHFRNNIELFE
jgi:hypothetical protein